MQLKEYRTRVDSLLSDRRLALSLLDAAQGDVDKSEADLEAANEALALTQHVAQQIQQQAHSRVATVVTRALQSVFGDEYEFKIEFERKRGKTEANLLLVKNDMEVDLLSGCGGGVVDVAALALRCAALILSKPPHRRVLFLDEPMKFVSENYRPAVRAMFEALSDELGVQFIIITHDEALLTGQIIRL